VGFLIRRRPARVDLDERISGCAASLLARLPRSIPDACLACKSGLEYGFGCSGMHGADGAQDLA